LGLVYWGFSRTRGGMSKKVFKRGETDGTHTKDGLFVRGGRPEKLFLKGKRIDQRERCHVWVLERGIGPVPRVLYWEEGRGAEKHRVTIKVDKKKASFRTQKKKKREKKKKKK